MRAFFLFFILLLAGCSNSEPVYRDSHGHAIRLSDYRNKWLVINYWATWCHPCVREIPELNAFATRYADKAVVLGVSYDKLTPSEIKNAVRQFKFNYPLLEKDPAQQFNFEIISVVPTTILINPQGTVEKYLYGPQTLQSLAAELHFITK